MGILCEVYLGSPAMHHAEAYAVDGVDDEGVSGPSAGSDAQPRRHRLVVAAFRADATNSIVAMENKIHNLEAEVLHVKFDGASTVEAKLAQQADLQFLPEGTGAAVHSTTLKQLASLGIRTWCDEDVKAVPNAEVS